MKTTIKILSLTLSIFLLLNPNNTKAQCHIDDWTALKALYESTDGDNWLIQDGWEVIIANQSNPSENCNLGNLHGVELDENGRVESLILSKQLINGNLPAELAGLTMLKYLNLSNNQLSGSIPAELGNLTNLTELFLSFNNLTGNIPSEFGSLTNLNRLMLAFNQLNGSIPDELSALVNLTELSLSYNELSGTIPTQIGNLSGLTKLQLSSNQLIGTIPIELANLTNLVDLSLNTNQLNGGIPSVLGDLENLNYLILNGNLLSGSIPPELGNLTSLTNLHLYSNNLSGAIPPELGNLISLDRLLLNTNQLSGSIPIELSNLINLTDLALNYNNLTGSIPTQIGDLISLTTLNFDGNELTGIIPISIGNLTNLEHLDLSFNNLEGVIPSQLGNLINLTFLGLGHNGITGSIPIELGNLDDLRELYLRYNSLSGNIPSELGNLSSLILMKLNHNQLEGNIPNSLSNLNNLVDLSLANNLLDGSIPNQIGNLDSLKELYLNGNRLTGNIPGSLGNLISLEELSLHENQLNGSIPNQLCNLTNLYDLRLNNNQLSGCYPNCLNMLCGQLTNEEISNDNNLDALWEDFCATSAGCCEANCIQPTSNVWPGDKNNDGIVDQKDVAMSGIGINLSILGSPRAIQHQNNEWYAHSAVDWGQTHYKICGGDMKHLDCDGNGIIDYTDANAILANIDSAHNEACTGLTTEVFPETDYQIYLQPTGNINNNGTQLVFNVVLESKNGNNISLQGGYFTIDYDNVSTNITNAAMNFSNSWLGSPNINMVASFSNFPNFQQIEIGFSKTDGTNSTGKGVIGQLTFVLDNNAARSENDLLAFEVIEIGVHDSQGNIQPIEHQYLQVGLSESNCEPNWTITEDSPFYNVYKSSGTIESNGFVLIGSNQQVEYKADRITLNSGFSIRFDENINNNDLHFKAGYGSCN